MTFIRVGQHTINTDAIAHIDWDASRSDWGDGKKAMKVTRIYFLTGGNEYDMPSLCFDAESPESKALKAYFKIPQHSIDIIALFIGNE